MKPVESAGILGATTWGLTLASLLAARGVACRVWCRTPEEAEKLRSEETRPARLARIALPPGVEFSAEPAKVAEGITALLVAVPSQSFRANLRRFSGVLDGRTIVISATKGLEIESCRRMSEIVLEEWGDAWQPRVAVLSGPNLAGEIVRGQPASTVVACAEEATARRVQTLLNAPTFRVYTQTDVIGVELGGALKNVIAVAAGISDGLGFGDNAKASLITRGLAEITRLGVAAGARASTFAGLAGLGDLVATCSSRLSRNHTVGLRLGQGERLAAIIDDLGQVAEGVPTTQATVRLGQALGVELPIAEQLHQVLFAGKSPAEAVADLMTRALTAEVR